MVRPIWSDAPDEAHYAAAASYISLVADPETVAGLITLFRIAPIAQYQAKDLLRASGLAALPNTNSHVAKDIGKIISRTPLSPVLLVRGDFRSGDRLQIADGYHRVCACHALDENAEVACRIVAVADLKAPRARRSPPARPST